jgi:hypothetical protein
MHKEDKAHALTTARIQLDFILQNIGALRKGDRNKRHENAARSMSMLLRNGEDLTAGQLSYVDGIYEQTMRALGLGHVPVHHDNRRLTGETKAL